MLSIEFDGKSLTTPVYLKMDSPDGLLLSEGVCRQLGIIMYHNEVRPVKTNSGKTTLRDESLSTVPLVQVNLLPHQSIVAQIHCDAKEVACLIDQPERFLLETGVQVEATLIEPDSRGIANVILSNPNGYSCHLSTGDVVGLSHQVTEIVPAEPANILAVMSDTERCELLREAVGKPQKLSWEQTETLHDCLEEFHTAFSLDDNERGETDLVKMDLDWRQKDATSCQTRSI